MLAGEPIGLLPLDQRCYTVYFAYLPLAHFDAWQRRIRPLPKAPSFDKAKAGAGDKSPSPATPSP
jgi:hypothetical protein